MTKNSVWKLIVESLEQHLPVMLLYVLESAGSSPGRAGFCMAVTAGGDMEGSIGGGIMEHKFVELAKERLQHGGAELSVKKQVHDKAAAKNQSGMICSGEQTVLMYKIPFAQVADVRLIYQSLETDRAATLHLSPAGIRFLEEHSGQQRYTYNNDDDWQYAEPLGRCSQLYIFGAGHCSLALSKVMCLLNFDIHLFDDRPGLNTFQQNHYAWQKTIVPGYEVVSQLQISASGFVVLMTMGYRSDDLVLRSLMHQPLAYLGVLGSRKKIEKMFQTYAAEGVDAGLLKRIFAPVGLPINSQTPEEIAISIAAQIIQVKNQKLV